MSDDTFTTDHPQTVALLTRALAAVAESTPTHDRSEELLADLDARSSDPDLPVAARPLGAAGDPALAAEDEPIDDVVVPLAGPRRRRRVLAVVAAIVVLLSVAAVALTRLGDDTSTGVVTSPGDVDTGWILPPEGWEVTSVDTDFLDIEGFGPCPCTQWAAARPGSDPASVIATESGPLEDATGLMTEGEPVDVDGREGLLPTWGGAGSGGDGLRTLVVGSGGRTLALHSAGVEVTDLVDLADGWLDQVDAGDAVDTRGLPLPEGFTGIAPATKGGAFEHMVIVRVRQPATAREVEYHVVPTGYDRSFLGIADSIEVGDGRIVALRATDQSDGGGAATRMLALVDDRLDVVVGDSLAGQPLPPLSAEELDAFVDGLREVSTAEWRDAIADADVSDAEVREAVSLFEPPLTG